MSEIINRKPHSLCWKPAAWGDKVSVWDVSSCVTALRFAFIPVWRLSESLRGFVFGYVERKVKRTYTLMGDSILKKVTMQGTKSLAISVRLHTADKSPEIWPNSNKGSACGVQENDVEGGRVIRRPSIQNPFAGVFLCGIWRMVSQYHAVHWRWVGGLQKVQICCNDLERGLRQNIEGQWIICKVCHQRDPGPNRF